MDIRIERAISDLESTDRALQKLQKELPLTKTLVGDNVFYGQIRAQINCALDELKGREKARETLWNDNTDVTKTVNEQHVRMERWEDAAYNLKEVHDNGKPMYTYKLLTEYSRQETSGNAENENIASVLQKTRNDVLG